MMKKFNRLWFLVFLAINIYYLYIKISAGTMDRIIFAFLIIPIYFVPHIIKKILHYDMSDTLRFIYYSFIFVAFIMGTVFGFYGKVECWDIIAHFMSGILTGVLGLIILKENNLIKKDNILFQILFIFAISMLVAVGWEFFEFFADMITHDDAQKVLETGVSDTMWDMFNALIGTIIVTITHLVLYKKSTNKEKLYAKVF